MRMDRYKENDEKTNIQEEQQDILSREIKNQDMYKDVYMNNTLVDINNYFDESENKPIDLPQEEVNVESLDYHEKSYDVNEYLEKAHEIHKKDDAIRSLENKDFIDAENQINKLMSLIEDNDEHHHVDESMSLDHALGDKTVFDLQTEKEKKLDYTFEKHIQDVFFYTL